MEKIKSVAKEYGLAIALLIGVASIFALTVFAINANIPVVSPILKAMFCRVDSEGLTQCFDREP